MTHADLSQILEAFQVAAGDRFAAKSELAALDAKVDLLAESVEEIRKNAKGANNWGKIASGLAALAPIATAIAKGAGWI